MFFTRNILFSMKFPKTSSIHSGTLHDVETYLVLFSEHLVLHSLHRRYVPLSSMWLPTAVSRTSSGKTSFLMTEKLPSPSFSLRHNRLLVVLLILLYIEVDLCVFVFNFLQNIAVNDSNIP